MKKLIYLLILPLVIIGGLVFANSATKDESPKPPIPKLITSAEKEAAMEQWYTTPGGMQFRSWEASPAGKKVYASEAKIRKQIRDSSHMQAVVTSLFLPEGSRLGFGVMVKISGEDYILAYGPDKPDELQQLNSLKVDDKIIIRSTNLSHAPKYAYPIIWLNYVEKDGKQIYKRIPPKNGC